MDEEIMETILPVKEPEEEPVERSFATVGAVYADGLSLIFDGETEPTEKHYLCNTSVNFAGGDRVKLAADSGTYVVEYVVGPPRQSKLVGIPAGGTTGQTLSKTSDADFAAGWTDAAHELPTGGSANQVLTKNSAANYDVKWAAVPDPAHELPSGGTDGQLLMKNGSTAYAVKWADAPAAQNVHNYGAAAASVIWLQFDASNGRLRVSLDHSNWRNLNFD